ncbi:TPA: hypothetical protein ACPZLH_001523 [Yersinia enterocolitica]
MKELDQFTVERLEKILQTATFAGREELKALARIVLSAKQAEPVAWKWRGAVGDILTQEKRKADFVMEHCPELPVTKLYATPPANSLVVPEGWKLVPKQATLAMLTLIGFTGSFDSMQYRYIKMLAAAPIYPVEGGE